MTRTPVLPTPTRRATSRDANPASYVNLKISRTLRIGNRSVGIGYSAKGAACADRITPPKHPDADRDHLGTLIAMMSESRSPSCRNADRDHPGILISMIPESAAGPGNSYAPEKIIAYVIGSRNRFFDNRLQVNLEGFLWRYKDHQEGVTTIDNAGASNFLIKNAGSATLKGFSADITARPTHSDTLNLSVEYNHAKYSSFVADYFALAVVPGVSTGCKVGPSSNGPALLSLDCSGFDVARAPRWSGSVGWQHEFRLSNGASLLASARGDYASARWGAINFVSTVRLPSYFTTNLDLTYTSANRRWSVGGFVHNVGNETVATGAQLFTFQASQGVWMLNPPRTYGGRMTFNF